MSRQSVRRWIVVGSILAMSFGAVSAFPARGTAADAPPAPPLAPPTVPTDGELRNRIGDTPIFPLDEVRPGLRGVAKTVVQGTRVESFDVEVLGVLEQAAPVGDLVLIRVSGPVIERTGGIASGMSGSPVYIDGRLLGAIGYGFDMADPTIGMVTPIASMRSVLELLPGYRAGRNSGQSGDAIVGASVLPKEDADSTSGVTPLRRPIAVGERVVKGVAFAPGPEQAKELRDTVGSDVSVMQPVATPLLAAGWGGRALDVLRDELATYPVTIVGRGGVAGGGAGDGVTDTAWTAVPGSAFGVQLIRGDVSLSAIGTITAVADDAFLGFGHPFLNIGATEVYATGAAIHTVVDSVATPFKIGSVLDPIGTIFQDRGAAVAGKLGESPSWIPIELRVQDEETRSIRLTRAEVADDFQLTVPLAASAALQGFDRSIDRLGAGTAEVTFEIEAEGLPTEFVRTNMYYSPSDISAYALTEFVNGLDLLMTNPFRELDITRVGLEAKVTRERHTARIEDVQPSKDEVRAGEMVDVEVTIRPFRQAPITQVVPLEVPHDTAAGDVVVTVRGGGIYFAPMDFGLPSVVAGSPPPVEPPVPGEEPDEGTDGEDPAGGVDGGASENLEGVITAFIEKERNNELIAEFYPPFQYGPPEGGGPPETGSPDEVPDDGTVEETEGETTPPSTESPLENETAEGAPAPPGGGEPGGGGDPQGAQGGADVDPDEGAVEPIRSRVETSYVMEGQQHFNLRILPPAAPEGAASNKR